MSDLDRAPLIRLQIDQEIFQDAVREDDVIDDATVATEVTSFERVSDAYVLEGAIVFAGYIHRGTNGSTASSDALDALSMGLGSHEQVEHLHHRLPFVLRVPVHAQPRGIVNVASRISSWQLAAVSEGWIRIVADLSIVGLSGSSGYHFQCGSQEIGDLFFEQAPDETADPGEQEAPGGVVDATLVDNLNDAVHAAPEVSLDEEWQLVRGRHTDDDGFSEAMDTRPADPETVRQHTERVSEARGGVPAEASDPAAPSDAPAHPSADQDTSAAHAIQAQTEPHRDVPAEARRGAGSNDWSPGSLKEELVGLDKAFTGRGAEAANAPADAKERSSGPADQADATDAGVGSTRASGQVEDLGAARTEPPASTDGHAGIAAFDVEHQVSSEELRSFTMTPEEAPSARAGGAYSGGDEAVTDTRAVSDGDAALLPVRDSAGDGAAEEAPAAGANVVLSAAETGSDAAVAASELWSFVDFNAPERYYTLRFVLVTEEETLDAVADRVGCTRSELLRYNQLSGDTLHPGQAIAVPQATVVPVDTEAV
ncbi:LysM peptidoglycan-binding domain-containing protein [Alicyclobacillus cycloheptanicus]|uniref:LysM domain-containing protein n=1 Tax=Alicyclobacillus cycloheptanicus TaxID=1457 RepID=A0ABT9XDB9_9BACL|nr:LysM peptidoglycan-binding domain-containing protein [Alicyclobacillus cycloheptanicus]MDQ0188294.1 hypothetical protein [Alicyclobacillus cycloheptanicus]WDM01010.1 LysM peptidoglycan-binding domain-containing protein [Alicyclobacillus cycloheptanicus]